MEFVLIIVLIIVIAIITPKPGDLGGADQLIIQKKKCPPHQWFWQEIIDQAGVRQGERIVCKVCGPLASQSGREE